MDPVGTAWVHDCGYVRPAANCRVADASLDFAACDMSLQRHTRRVADASLNSPGCDEIFLGCERTMRPSNFVSHSVMQLAVHNFGTLVTRRIALPDGLAPLCPFVT